MRSFDLPKLHRDVAFGRAGGRIIWQPRIECWYDDRVFAGEPFPGEFAGLDGLEAITPKPQGDVEPEAVKEALGDMYLIDGIAAILLEQAQKVIDLFAPNLILGISDEISSTGELERIREVGKVVDAYNARRGSS